MASYGRNFEFRVPPVHGQRGGRYVLPTTETALVIGAPIKVSGGQDDSGRLPVAKATGAQAPIKGQCGILVYEVDPGIAFAGTDPALTTYSDINKAVPGRGVQLVSGDGVKVVLKNTEDRTFLNSREYEGLTIFDEDAPLTVGQYLTPGVGTDADGYWAVTGSKSNAWLVVEGYDADRHEVEARFIF